jgi:hypothetical protein
MPALCRTLPHGDRHGPAPQPCTPVMLGDQEAGEMRSAQCTLGLGLALLRLELLEEAD